MQPHLILAALTEATHPVARLTRYDQGLDWAAGQARQLLTDARMWARYGDRVYLAAATQQLRAWIADGPDLDCEDYERGCADGQAQIARILDGDRGEIRDLLDDARQRAERLWKEAAVTD